MWCPPISANSRDAGMGECVLLTVTTKRYSLGTMDDQASNISRIESLFPNDQLSLAGEPCAGVGASVSAGPSSGKRSRGRRPSLPSNGLLRQLRGGGSRAPITGPDSPDFGSGAGPGGMAGDYVSRRFLHEGPAQFTVGLQTQERYLFLFNDLIFVAKQRTPRSFKLKHRVALADLWIADSTVDVSERPVVHQDRSFVIGWPTTNFLVTFPSAEACHQWKEKLRNQIMEEKGGLSSSVILSVFYKNSSDQKMRELDVGKEEEAELVMNRALALFNIPVERVSDFQLWVQSTREDSAYPLFGHELPYAIQSCHDRESAQGGSVKCEFYLTERNKKVTKIGNDFRVGKKSKRKPLNLIHLLRRPSGKSSSQTALSVPSYTRSQGAGCLLGKSPQTLCEENGGNFPPALMELLTVTYESAGYLPEVFRKSCLDKQRREAVEKLDSKDPIGWNDDGSGQPLHGFVHAAILKEFLRRLPDSLLGHTMKVWMDASGPDHSAQFQEYKRLLDVLPSDNLRLLRYIFAILHAVKSKDAVTLMNSSNLGIVIGPSLLWPRGSDPSQSATHCATPEERAAFCVVAQKQGPQIVAFLIDRALAFFGVNLLQDTFGGPPTPTGEHAGPSMIGAGEVPLGKSRLTSASEVSEDSGSEGHHHDAVNQGRISTRAGIDRSAMAMTVDISLPRGRADTQESVEEDDEAVGVRERRGDYLESLESLSEHEPPPSRPLNQMSPSCMSRDSGLTMSENPEEEGQSDESPASEKVKESPPSSGREKHQVRRQFRQRRDNYRNSKAASACLSSSQGGSDELLHEGPAQTATQASSGSSAPAVGSTVSLPTGILSTKSTSCHSLVVAQASEPLLKEANSASIPALRRSGGKSGSVGGDSTSVEPCDSALGAGYPRPTSLDSHQLQASSLTNLASSQDDTRLASGSGVAGPLDPTLLTKSSSGVHLEWSKEMDSSTSTGPGARLAGVGRLQRKLGRLVTMYAEIGHEEKDVEGYSAAPNSRYSKDYRRLHSSGPLGVYSSGGDSSSPSDSEPPSAMTLPLSLRQRRNSNPATPNELEELTGTRNHFTFDLPEAVSTAPPALLATVTPANDANHTRTAVTDLPHVSDSYDRVTIRHLTPMKSDHSPSSPPSNASVMSSSAQPSLLADTPSHAPSSSAAAASRGKDGSYSELLPTKQFSLSAAPPLSQPPVAGGKESAASPPAAKRQVIRKVVKTTTTVNKQPGAPAGRLTTVTTLTNKPSAPQPLPQHSRQPPPFKKSLSDRDFVPPASSAGPTASSSSSRPRQPPNYAEAMHKRKSNGSVPGNPAPLSESSSEGGEGPTEAEIMKQSLDSRLAKHMYQSSLQAYERQQHAQPKPPARDAPAGDKTKEYRASIAAGEGTSSAAGEVAKRRESLQSPAYSKLEDRSAATVNVQRSHSQSRTTHSTLGKTGFEKIGGVSSIVAGINNNQLAGGRPAEPHSISHYKQSKTLLPKGMVQSNSGPSPVSAELAPQLSSPSASRRPPKASGGSRPGSAIFFQPRFSGKNAAENAPNPLETDVSRGSALFYRPENPPPYDHALKKTKAQLGVTSENNNTLSPTPMAMHRANEESIV